METAIFPIGAQAKGRVAMRPNRCYELHVHLSRPYNYKGPVGFWSLGLPLSIDSGSRPEMAAD